MYTYNIVVIGAVGAGKSAWITSVSEIPNAQSKIVQAVEREVYLDYGKITRSADEYISIFSAPAHQKYDFMWEILAEGLHGLVALVDSANPDSFDQFRQQFKTFLGYISPKPFVVAANKQDLPNALSPEALREALEIPPEIPVLPCVAIDKASALQIYEAVWKVISKANP